MHCDLKEANIMVAADSNWDHPHVVLIDFGLAMNFADKRVGICGTPGYIPPETWQKGYWVPKGDVFSLGVVFFQLMSGIDQLFGAHMGARTMDDVAQATMAAPVPLNLLGEKYEFQELVGKMLEKDPAPDGRVTIGQVAGHSWFHNMRGEPIDPHVLRGIQLASNKTEMQLKAAEIMLDRVNVASLRGLNEAFRAIDRDASGVITAEEAMQAANTMAGQLFMSPEELRGVVMSMANSRGEVTYNRFMSSILQQQKGFSAVDLTRVFCEVDVNRNGILEDAELRQVILRLGYPEQEAQRFAMQMQRDSSGRVTFHEFKKAVLGE
jgi:Ca2+-binding EF-hand superfamily protein